ncbi:MAG: hypothetical protein AAFU53_10595, partial [Cyanobacteria bacterium J06632_3]
MTLKQAQTFKIFRRLLLGISTSTIMLGTTAQVLAVSLASAPLETTSTLIAQSPSSSSRTAELILETRGTLTPNSPTENNQFYSEISFQGQAGQEIVITAQTEDAYREYIPLTPLVVGPSGNPVQGAENFDFYFNDVFSGIRLTLPQSGTYRLRIQSNTSFLRNRQLSALPFQVSIWNGVEGYELLEQAELLTQQIFSFSATPNIPDFSSLSESELEALSMLSESELAELFSPSLSIGEPDPEVLAQLSQSVSSAFQLFQSSNDKAGQLFILQRYPEYTTASTGDDDFRMAQLEIVGQIADAFND